MNEQHSRLAFRGKPEEYHDHLLQVLRRYRSYFENVQQGLGGLKLDRKSKKDFTITLASGGMIKVGRQLDPLHKYPLRFKDGSILTIAQKLYYDGGICWVKESVIRFAKLDASQTVQYFFHYDTVQEIPDHPDHHLQFEYDRHVNTPRFPLRAYEGVGIILQMIIRDKIAC